MEVNRQFHAPATLPRCKKPLVDVNHRELLMLTLIYQPSTNHNIITGKCLKYWLRIPVKNKAKDKVASLHN
jgi:hypothetical protein